MWIYLGMQPSITKILKGVTEKLKNLQGLWDEMLLVLGGLDNLLELLSELNRTGSPSPLPSRFLIGDDGLLLFRVGDLSTRGGKLSLIFMGGTRSCCDVSLFETDGIGELSRLRGDVSGIILSETSALTLLCGGETASDSHGECPAPRDLCLHTHTHTRKLTSQIKIHVMYRLCVLKTSEEI